MWWVIAIIFIAILWESGVSSKRYKELDRRIEDIEDKLEQLKGGDEY